MKIICETSLANFQAWSGGKDTMDDLSVSDCDKLEQYLNELHPEGMDDGELNDFLWYERDSIVEILGYRNYEALANQDKESWEDHARTVIAEEIPDADEDMVDEYITYEYMEGTSDEDVIEEFKQYVEDNK